MFGRRVRLIAANGVLTLGRLQAASTGSYGYGGYGHDGYGGYGGYGTRYGGGYGFGGGNGYGNGNGCCGPTSTVADWGCGTSCEPLLPSFSYGSNCCAPVRWGCGNPCGNGG